MSTPINLEGVWSRPREEQEDILNGPALNPPPGVDPNFSNPENHNAAGLLAIVICLVFVSILVPIRAYSKAFRSRGVYFEDSKTLLPIS